MDFLRIFVPDESRGGIAQPMVKFNESTQYNSKQICFGRCNTDVPWMCAFLCGVSTPTEMILTQA